jgi:membrane-bound lytic murein transglycosylase D
MMRKLLVSAMALLCFAVAAHAQVVYRDPSAAAAQDEALPFPGQNPMYKSRLDSIQKTVPLRYNEYVQKFIDIYAARKGQIAKILGLSGYYFPIFERSLKEYQVPEEIKFVSIVESALDPHAVSRTGATGPWQFMPATAKGYGLKMDKTIDERKDPATASHAAAAYFRDAYNDLGDWVLAIAAYNCGKGAVARAIQRSGGKTDFWEIRQFLPVETRNYVPAFIATTYIMNYYSKHDIQAAIPDLPTLTDVIEVSSKVSLELIAKAAHFDLKQLLRLNPSYKKQVVNGSPSSPKHIVIPAVRDNESFTALYQAINNEHPLPAQLASRESEPVTKKTSSKAGSYVSYKVRPGDTLSEIAEKFNRTIAQIKSRNKLRSSILQPGMVLKIAKV